MDTQIYLVIAGTFIGFIALAFVLLYPIYRFLTREEKAAQTWTPDAIARRQGRDAPSGDGAPGDDIGDLPGRPRSGPPTR